MVGARYANGLSRTERRASFMRVGSALLRRVRVCRWRIGVKDPHDSQLARQRFGDGVLKEGCDRFVLADHVAKDQPRIERRLHDGTQHLVRLRHAVVAHARVAVAIGNPHLHVERGDRTHRRSPSVGNT
jgi:hypothetical protein